jgi:hypothetical protein
LLLGSAVPICGGGGGWWKRWLCGGVVEVVGGVFDYAVVVRG